MTLNGHNHSIVRFMAHHENLNEYSPVLSAEQYSLGTVVSGNRRIMPCGHLRGLSGLWRGGVERL